MMPKHSSRGHSLEGEAHESAQAAEQAEQAVGEPQKRAWARELARRFLAWPPPRTPVEHVDAVLGVAPLESPPRPIDDDLAVRGDDA